MVVAFAKYEPPREVILLDPVVVIEHVPKNRVPSK
jgi:hypothetical protein